jgi:hypothetical protein
MDHDLTESVERRLRAARPPAAAVDPDAFDPAMLARVVASPPAAPRRRARLAVPAGGLAALVIAGAVVLVGDPSATHAPRPDSAAAAVQRAALWFAMPPGRILHYRAVSTEAGETVMTQEVWESTDDPNRARHAEGVQGVTVELAGSDLYDAARDTIYDYVPPSRGEAAATLRREIARKIDAARASGAGREVVKRLRSDRDRLVRQLDAPPVPARTVALPSRGDPTVEEIHQAFDAGRATAGPQTDHDGVEARPITITWASRGTPVRWVLWTAADDGRPLELSIDHGPGTPIVGGTTYPTYELLPDTDADRLLTLSGAHPGAQVVRSEAAYQAAELRLFPNG